MIAYIVGAQAIDPCVQMQLREAHHLGLDSDVLSNNIEQPIGRHALHEMLAFEPKGGDL